jgi:hypothetical protein
VYRISRTSATIKYSQDMQGVIHVFDFDFSFNSYTVRNHFESVLLFFKPKHKHNRALKYRIARILVALYLTC